MLAELRVANLVLIEQVHLELHAGLNVFTGETGAGKSLLVDALDLLFGARGEPDLVRPGAEAAEVSARFLLADRALVEALEQDLGLVFEVLPSGTPARSAPPRELVVSRLLPREGRARAYANGRPLALAALRELGDRLVDLHGQHENQSLLRPATRLEILDRFAGAEVQGDACRKAHAAARHAAEQLAELRRAAREKTEREGLARFQLKELEDARLDELDPAALESDLKLLRSAEAIHGAAQGAADQLDGEEGQSAAGLLARALKGLEGLSDPGAETAALGARLAGLLADTRDLAHELAALAEKAQGQPERLAELEDLRAGWHALERKHGRDLAGLKALRDELSARLAELARLDVRTEECEAELERAVAALRAAAAQLTRQRQAAARDLQRRVAGELGDLGLKGATLSAALVPHVGAADARGTPESSAGGDEVTRLIPAGLRPTGAEGLEFLFSANPELPLKPLGECASGGELSRVMLALKGVLARANGADRLPVVVFDEVDSGVGGRTGAVLGRKLAGLGRVRQVLCVTHLPQLAVYAQRQIKVEKARHGGAAIIRVTPVDGPARVDELALMLRGEAASERTRAEAEEMLRAAQGELEARPAKRRGGSD